MLTKRLKASAPQRLNQAARANLRESAQSSRRERNRDRFNPRGRRIARRNLFALVFTDRKREFDGFTGHRQRFLDRGPERRYLGKGRHDDLKGILIRLQYHGVLQFGHAMGFAERARMPLGEGARTPATTYAVKRPSGAGPLSQWRGIAASNARVLGTDEPFSIEIESVHGTRATSNGII